MPELSETLHARDASADILIAGGGFVGLALALAVARAAPSLAICVVDAGRPTTAAGDQRASAISADVRLMLEKLGVWAAVAAAAEPVREMVVTDSRVGDVLRPSLLAFGDAAEAGEPLAHMVANAALLAALREAVVASPATLLAPDSAGDFAVDGSQTIVSLAGGRTWRARLLVAADGSRSQLRENAGIPTLSWAYGQSAIVATVAHERPHGGRAYEHFLPAGPFATLPLTGNRSSLVWTETNAAAERLLAGDRPTLEAELARRFGHRLGALTLAGAVEAYPLRLQVARRFIGERFALVGDAAHTIHPLAGQGLNLGLRDVAALAECLVEGARLGLDIGSSTILERYDRWRRGETLAMAALTDGLNRLFTMEAPPLRIIRDVGLGLVDRWPAAKDFLTLRAKGVAAASAPRLLQGRAI